MSRIRDSIDSRVFDIENYANELQGPHVSGPVTRGTYLVHVQILLNVISIMEANASLAAEQKEEQEHILTDLEEINNLLRRDVEEARNAAAGWEENFRDAAAEITFLTQDRDWWQNSSAEWNKLQKKTQAALEDALYAQRTNTPVVETDVTLLDSNPHTLYVAENPSGGIREFRSLELARVWGTLVAVYPPWLDIEPDGE